jgi:hypothetical protein
MRKLLCLVVLGSVFVVPDVASAGDADDCAYELQPVSRIGDRILAQPVLIGCYDTYPEALAAGSDGAIDVPTGTTPLTLETSVAVQTSGTVLIGTEFDAIAYAGASNSYYASETCSAFATWEVDYVTDQWNDRFSSGRGFGGCDHNRKFQHSQFNGSVLLCTPNCSNYGTLNNAVSSLRWAD